MNADSSKCIDPNVGRMVFRSSILRGKTDDTPKDPAIGDHLARCEFCRRSFPEWQTNAQAAQLMSEAERVINGDLLPNERVEQKLHVEGRILFKYSVEQPLQGLLVSVNTDGKIVSVSASVSRNQFEQLN